MSPDQLDLEAYLKRVGYAGARRPALAVLEELHLAHATHIPFENIDVLLKRPIHLDLPSLQEKLVAGGRGGYCFEQNLLFAAALGKLGFDARLLAAKVRHRGDKDLPRTHMLLLVSVEGAGWLADVGFGGEGLLQPVPFGDGREVQHYAWGYRVIEEKTGQWLLQSRRQDGWGNLYSFTLDPQTPADCEMANHYTSTHPDSPFVNTLTAQLPTPAARYVLRNRELVTDRGGGNVVRRTLRDDDELLEVLAGTFGLHFPAGTRFAYRDA
ncbi:MAG TPA: arylamine N-acetyltransferase [Burkholderiales bacterium]|nr:arylamine N-acetyltransferase [Burkholderiales bacterium]